LERKVETDSRTKEKGLQSLEADSIMINLAWKRYNQEDRKVETDRITREKGLQSLEADSIVINLAWKRYNQ
jgi:hypothetical protein